MSDPTVEITAKQFAQLVRPLVPLAGKDDMLPILNAIQFETQDDYLVGLCTDRFRLGIHRVKLERTPSPASFLLSLATVAHILAMFKPSRYADPLLKFTVESDRLRVETVGGMDFIMDASVTFPVMTDDFPRVRKVLLDQLAADSQPTTDLGVNAAYLADFRHAITDATPLSMHLVAADKPIIFTAGGDFIGMSATDYKPRHRKNALVKRRPRLRSAGRHIGDRIRERLGAEDPAVKALFDGQLS